MSDKTRVQFDITDDNLDELNKLKLMIGVETRKELFNNALTLLTWAVDEISKGNNIVSKNAANECEAVHMPIFRHVRKHKTTLTAG